MKIWETKNIKITNIKDRVVYHYHGIMNSKILGYFYKIKDDFIDTDLSIDIPDDNRKYGVIIPDKFISHNDDINALYSKSYNGFRLSREYIRNFFIEIPKDQYNEDVYLSLINKYRIQHYQKILDSKLWTKKDLYQECIRLKLI